MRDVYIHINHLRTRFKNKYLKEIEPQKHDPIMRKRMMLSEATGIKRYYDLIRIMGRVLEVTCTRNDYNSYEGINIIGRNAQVCLFEFLLLSIIKKINKETSNAPRHARMNIHLNEHRANLRTKAVGKYIELFQWAEALKREVYDPWPLVQEKDLRLAYIKSSPLKSQKAFRH
jgi:hypothetical protein